MVSPHDKYAEDYDKQIRTYDCWLAEVLFGLCYEDIQEGETLLDVGIGTGLSSRLFHQAGLRIFGIDGSQEMLSLCQNKGITLQLVQQDINQFPLPYQSSSFKHIISCGVFHFISELNSVFSEIMRVQEPNGCFLFSVMKSREDLMADKKYEEKIIDDIPIYSHNDKYVESLLAKYQYEMKKDIVCFVGDTPFRVIYSRKIIT